MLSVFCPECGAYVDEIYEDELPIDLDCGSCQHEFTEEVPDGAEGDEFSEDEEIFQ